MKVIILTDMEGVSGVVVWEQTRDRNSHHYQEARGLLMEDISAAVEGCIVGGAAEVVVVDGHGGGYNFVPSMMHPHARYLTGCSRPPHSQQEHLYDGFDAAILLGYHAMQGTADGILQHTQSSLGGNRYWYNDEECGEIVQSALVMGYFGTPVVMLTGDEAACREADQFLGEHLITVAVKEGCGEQYGLLLAPQASRELIREGAAEALARIGNCSPYVLKLPIYGQLQFPDKSTADSYTLSRGQRQDDHTYTAVFERALDIYEF